MAHSPALREIGKYVDNYIMKKKLMQDDYFVFLQHACDCYRKINLRHSNEVMTVKVAVSALGIIEWPSDMIGFGFLAVPINGELWTFTRKGRKVMTTTTTLGVEGQDATMGEGVDVTDSVYTGIGGRGGVNAYYLNIDERARRITCDGFKSDTAILQYTSDGLVVSGATYIPTKCEPVLDAYLSWQIELIEPRSIGMIRELKNNYDNEIKELRILNLMPSKDEICDIFDGNSTIGVQR